MELLADRDPEEARKILDPVLELMMASVHRYEGTVNQVMGDGIMALFGAPVALEDHAVRACYAALGMQEAARRYNETVRRSQGIELQLRVGINSGEVVVRSISSDLRMDYTAVGQTTHLAARMEQLASPGTVRLTAETLRLSEGYVEVRSLGLIPVKGLAEPVEMHELTGAGPVRRRFEAAAVRGLTRFVGRRGELDQLTAALGLAKAGHGQIAAVVGEPGVGKSRLFHEFTHSHRTHGCLILESGSASYGKATAYLPIIDLLKAYFQIESRDDERKIREKVTGKLLALHRHLEPALPAILALLDVPVEDRRWQALDPPQRRRQTLHAIEHLLLRESQVQPLCLVFEDLHWTDGQTLAVLDSLVESLPGASVLMLVNYRPEYEDGWAGKLYYTRLKINPLSAVTAEELLEALLGSDASLAVPKQVLIEHTEGNPFFLEESVRALVEIKVLTGERGAYRLAKPVHTIQVPATVQAVLAARIDRLSPDDKYLLQSASVIGETVPFHLLQAVVEASEEDLCRALGRMQQVEFLYESGLFPDIEYTFTHGLTHQVAYNSLLQQRRKTLHAKVVGAIERLYADRLSEQVETLARHALRGESWEKAVGYLREAGRKATSRSAHKDAVACFEDALVALRHMPETRDALEQAFDLRLDLRNALVPLGEVQRMLDDLREAEAIAHSLDDRQRQGRVLSFLSSCFWVLGRHREALETAHRTLAMARELDDAALGVYATVALSWTYHSVGDYDRGIEFGRTAVDFLRGDRLWERYGVPSLPAVSAHTWLASCLAERGDFEQAIAHGEAAVRLAETVRDPWSLVAAYLGLGISRLRRGDLADAINALERGLGVCRQFDIQIWFPPLASSLGHAYALSGRLPEALPLLSQSVEQAGTTNLQFYRSLATVWLSQAHLLAGRVDEAAGLAEAALKLARDHGEMGNAAYCLWQLGEISRHAEPPKVDEADAFYRAALEAADRLGMKPLVARCHRGLSELCRRIGRTDTARAHSERAATVCRELGMTR
jgi:class 3 adenylate cyclase/tetratricopeptide (TPR) repeat protein